MDKNIMKRIAEYMSSMGNREFTQKEAKTISSAIYMESADRKANKIAMQTRTNKGKQELNERTAVIVNKMLRNNSIKAEHIQLFKRCRCEEFTDRTGKCAWGFKEVRKRLGFDEDTGLELEFNN